MPTKVSGTSANLEEVDKWSSKRLRLARFGCAICVVIGLAACAPKLRLRSPRLMLLNQGGRLTLKGMCPPHSKSCTPLEPVDPGEYVDRRNGNYRQSGFVNLNPGMRLRIEVPIPRAGAAAAALGYEKATYSLQAAKQQSLSVSLDSIQVSGQASREHLPRTDYLKNVPDDVYLRLYVQLRHPLPGQNIVLLQAPSQGKLNEASGAFEEAPAQYCATPEQPGVRCIIFPSGTSAKAEVQVKVKKKFLFVPLGGTVADALAAYGADDPAHLAHRLKVTRIWQMRRVPVKFDRDSTAILGFALTGGDNISW